MDEKKMKIIDLILIVGTLVSLLIIVGYARPLLIFPTGEIENLEGNALFEFNGGRVLLDDNPSFSSPEVLLVEEGYVLRLSEGVFYWKAGRVVHKLTLRTEVEFGVREVETGAYELVNVGDENLDVGVYDSGEFVGNIVLGRQNLALGGEDV